MDTQLDKGTPGLMHFQNLGLMLLLIFAAWISREDQRGTSEVDIPVPHLTIGWSCTKSFQKDLLPVIVLHILTSLFQGENKPLLHRGETKLPENHYKVQTLDILARKPVGQSHCGKDTDICQRQEAGEFLMACFQVSISWKMVLKLLNIASATPLYDRYM